VLAEHGDGNIKQVLKRCRLNQSHEWKSYVYGEQAFHYISDIPAGLCYLCIADKKFGRKLPFAFLRALQTAFKERFPAGAPPGCSPGDFQAFAEDIQVLMHHHNSPDNRVSNLMAKVESVNENLSESMDKLMERQEKIDVLVERSDSLATSSMQFQQEARTLRKAVTWRNKKVLMAFGLFGVTAVCLLGLIMYVD
jgi:vesicle-associated membrane protein 7